MNCPSCGAPCQDTAKFCPNCGYSLPRTSSNEDVRWEYCTVSVWQVKFSIFGGSTWQLFAEAISPTGKRTIANSETFKDVGLLAKSVINTNFGTSEYGEHSERNDQNLVVPEKTGAEAQTQYSALVSLLLGDGWELISNGKYWCNPTFRRQVK